MRRDASIPTLRQILHLLYMARRPTKEGLVARSVLDDALMLRYPTYQQAKNLADAEAKSHRSVRHIFVLPKRLIRSDKALLRGSELLTSILGVFRVVGPTNVLVIPGRMPSLDLSEWRTATLVYVTDNKYDLTGWHPDLQKEFLSDRTKKPSRSRHR